MAEIKKRHIQRRDKNGDPVARYDVRFRDPTGKVRTQTFTSKDAARKAARANETDRDRGEWIDPTGALTPFGEVADQWLKTKRNVAQSTRVNIDGHLRNHLYPRFKEMPIGRIRTSDVRGLVAEMEEAGKSPDTIAKSVQVLGQVFRLAVADELIRRSPVDPSAIDLPACENHEEMRFLTEAEVLRISDAITARHRPLVLTAAYCGLRAGELVALQVGDIDLDAGTITVERSAREVGGHGIVIGKTKTRRTRKLDPAPEPILDSLAGMIAGRSRSAWVFTSTRGEQLRWRNFYRRHFVPAVEAAQIDEPRPRFHDLRHTCAAFLIADRWSLEHVRQYLGHSSIRVTSERYAHLLPDSRREMADGLAARFRRARDIRAMEDVLVFPPGRAAGA